MQKEKSLNYKIRVPSHIELTTPANIWKFVQQVIPKIPHRFENNDVANIKEYPINNEIAISRTLSYLKYLGLITEERVQGVGDENKQFFNMTEQSKILKKTAIVEPENLYNKYKEILKESELYKAIVTNEEYTQYSQMSKTTLRKLLAESFTKKVKNVKERVDKAEEYMVNFLREVELFTFDGNYLKPMSETSIVTKGEINNKIKKQEKDVDDMKEEYDEDKFQDKYPKDEFYHVKTDDYELRVRYDDLAIEMLESQINIAKMKLKSIKPSKTKNKELKENNKNERQEDELSKIEEENEER